MEEALELSKYLPISFKTKSEHDYINFLWEAFETNYESGKYQFAFLAYHMLAMSFVYFNIWQIKQTKPNDFANAMIGFNKDLEKELINATCPFTFWRVNESIVMRFLKLIGCDNDKIGCYAALVKKRNETAHCNGNIFFSTQAALDIKIREILRVVDEIQAHSVLTIECSYAFFLHESNNSEDREYSENADQIREILIHAHYLSQKDIEICAALDIADEFDIHPNFPGVESLHQTLIEIYTEY